MTRIYYKATRPDGTDFHTGTVDYAGALASGKPLKRLDRPYDNVYKVCSPFVYHASDTPAETLIGGTWPCRLFEVTGKPVAQAGHKYGFRSLRVQRELPAWQALGPNGEAVAAHIKCAGQLTPDEATRLYAAEAAARYAAGDAAWDAARVAAGDAVWDAARVAAWDAARVAAGDAVWAAARDAAWDAAGTLVVRDLITPEHFNLLYGPWHEVIGE